MDEWGLCVALRGRYLLCMLVAVKEQAMRIIDQRLGGRQRYVSAHVRRGDFDRDCNKVSLTPTGNHRKVSVLHQVPL